MRISKPTRRERRPRGLTLTELLAVIAIMAIVAVLALGSLQNFSIAMDVTDSTQRVGNVLNLARQNAVSRNKYVQVRFYRPAGAQDGYTGMAFFQADSPLNGTAAEYAAWETNGLLKQEGKMTTLPSSCALVADPAASALFATLATKGQSGTASYGGKALEWVGVYFKPDGSLGLDAAAVGLNMALCQAVRYQAGGKLPANYAVLTLDRMNGRFQVVRP